MLENLQASGVKIVIALVPPGSAVEIIHHAHMEGLKWPKYAWILIDFDIKDFGPVMENILVIKQKFQLNVNKRTNIGTNPHANVLYDSVWALALAMNASLAQLYYQNISLVDYRYGNMAFTKTIDNELQKLSFAGANGLVNFSQRTNRPDIPITIFQIQNGEYVLKF